MKPADAIVTMGLVVTVTLAAAGPAQAANKICAPAKIVAAGEYTYASCNRRSIRSSTPSAGAKRVR